MINLFRIFVILLEHQIFKHIGIERLNITVFSFGRLLEIMFFPFRRKKHISQNLGEALLKTFQRAGPIYIKFGQTLSTRPDIIGEETAEYLKELQDKLPPFSYHIAKDMIEKEFKQKLENIFADFEEKPVAAASISQVHKATLKNKTKVAVKILRPNIRMEYERDIKMLYWLAKIATFLFDGAKRLRLIEAIDLSKNIMIQELDLSLEAASSNEMWDNSKNDNIVEIPEVYWQYTSSNIMVTKWIDGFSIYDLESIKKANLDTKTISQKIATMFFNQAYRDGFFHADLHPGNILVTKDGKIGLVDFGIAGRLPERDRLAVTEILHGFLNKNYYRIAQIHLNMGYIPKNSDLNLFALNCRIIGESIVGEAAENISVGKILGQLFKITRDFGMETQPQLLLLQKTTIVVEGIGRMLNPKLNMWKLAEPWVKKWAARNISPEAKLLRIIKTQVNRLFEEII